MVSNLVCGQLNRHRQRDFEFSLSLSLSLFAPENWVFGGDVPRQPAHSATSLNLVLTHKLLSFLPFSAINTIDTILYYTIL